MATYQSVGVADVLIVMPHLDRARDSLRAAELLLAQRLAADALTRAHQATVHVERALLATEKRNPQSFRSVHRLATNHFLQPGHIDEGFIVELDALQLQRERADDQPLAEFGDDEVGAAIQTASRLLGAAELLLVERGFIEVASDTGDDRGGSGAA